MKMGFFDIATELRLRIYSELLILSESITFVADFDPSLSPLTQSQSTKVHPAILYVNRMAYREASPILYSNNRFQFPEINGSGASTSTHAHIAPFLNQIGLQASHIRHICIPFPKFNYFKPKKAKLHEAHIKNLELIRKTCIKLRTLELLDLDELCYYALNERAIAVETLNILNTHIRTIRSLNNIIINFEVYLEDNPSDDLMKIMHNFGWTVKITRLPKRVWISIDDRVEFDNEEDYDAYNDERCRWELKMEEEKEEKMWLEDYYERRRDPYWKNDSDYD
jgi:hypothetical protein